MSDLAHERPCIHVCVVGDADPNLYGWVEIGAEEEGLPTREVALAEYDVVKAAHAAAQGSRFGVGVAIARGRVVLHEVHMPPGQPVLAFELDAAPQGPCRTMGGNAARLVVRLPLRLAPEGESQPSTARPAVPAPVIARREAILSNDTANEVEVKRIATIVARLLLARGIL
jgi:hypothetical protein